MTEEGESEGHKQEKQKLTKLRSRRGESGGSEKRRQRERRQHERVRRKVNEFDRSWETGSTRAAHEQESEVQEKQSGERVRGRI